MSAIQEMCIRDSIEVISNWMTLQNVNPFLRDVAKGAIILLALLLDNVRRGKLAKNEMAA